MVRFSALRVTLCEPKTMRQDNQSITQSSPSFTAAPSGSPVKPSHRDNVSQTSRTTLYSKYVQVLGQNIGIELEEIETDYSMKGDWQFLLDYSSLAKKVMGVLHE